jgi:hypothetical protein
MTRLISALLLVASFGFASSPALANWKDSPPPATQGGSGNDCNNNNPGCVQQPAVNGGGNNPQGTCDGPKGQCK